MFKRLMIVLSIVGSIIFLYFSITHLHTYLVKTIDPPTDPTSTLSEKAARLDFVIHLGGLVGILLLTCTVNYVVKGKFQLPVK